MKESIGKAARQSSIFAKIGRLSYRYRLTVIVLWGILLLLSLVISPHLESVLQGVVTTYESGEAFQAEKVLNQELSIDPEALTLVFASLDNRALSEHKAEIEQKLTQIRALSTVKEVPKDWERPENLSADGRSAYSQSYLKVKGIDIFPAIANIKKILTENEKNNLEIYLTGKKVFDYEDHQISQNDLVRAEIIALPLTLIALLFVFGSVIAAILPIAMAVMTVSVSCGLLYLFALQMDISVFALNLTTMLGLGIGIDFALVMVSRFREELSAGSLEQAVVRTVDTAGRAVFFSGLTTCIGLVSLLLFPINLLQSLGLAGSVVVFLSIGAALTLLPALLGLLGSSLNAWRILNPTSGTQRFWGEMARHVIRHSILAVALVLVVVMGMTSPFLEARWGLGGVETLPADVEARKGVEVLEQAFGNGAASPILLTVRSTDPNTPILSKKHIATLYPLVKRWEADPRVDSVKSLFNIDPQLNPENYQQLYAQKQLLSPPLLEAVKQLSNDSITLIKINSKTDSNDKNSFALVKELRDLNASGLQFLVGGQTASSLDTIEVVTRRFPWVLAAMMAVTFVALTILFQSVILPLKAIFLNLMSISASFGALVFVFQQGNFKTWLNFTPVGYIDILLPIVMFCVLFGLSMDYEVFLLTRMKEVYDRTGNNRVCIIEGLERTGQIITSAALLMIIVTGAFAFTSLIFIKALGLGVAIAVFVDSTLIRAVLVPASMNLLGKWNWWSPRFLHLDRFQWRLD
jgi:putative drug exporter of the RND superfamily